MKAFWIKQICLFALIMGLLFSLGCVNSIPGVSTEQDSLKVLTPEEIESIFAAISYEETVKYPLETDTNGNNIVFWLDGGKVWHASQACSTIKKADPTKVKSGTVSDALKSGKERACKICAVGLEYSEHCESSESTDANAEEITTVQTDKYPKEYFEDGELIVFWLESGKVWHESRHCSSLSRSDPSKIKQGTAAQAAEAGKERVCKNCP